MTLQAQQSRELQELYKRLHALKDSKPELSELSLQPASPRRPRSFRSKLRSRPQVLTHAENSIVATGKPGNEPWPAWGRPGPFWPSGLGIKGNWQCTIAVERPETSHGDDPRVGNRALAGARSLWLDPHLDVPARGTDIC